MDNPKIDHLLHAARLALLKMTRKPHLIDDLSQTVLMKCLVHCRQTGAPPSVPYVVRMAQYEYCSWWRKNHLRKRQTGSFPEGFDGPSRETAPADALEQAELSAAVRTVLQGLPPRYQDLARLRLLEGWTVLRIAKSKRLAQSTVKRLLGRALLILRERLKSYSLN